MHPTLYKKEYCEMLVEHMEQGYSFESFGGVVKVGRKTLYDWADRHEEFQYAKDAGYAAGLKLFETIKNAKILGKELKGVNLKQSDTTLLIFTLKTVYHDIYGDKTKHEHVQSGKFELSYNLEK